MLRFSPRALESLGHQNEIAAVAAGIHVGSQLRAAGFGPMTILQGLREFFLVGASAKVLIAFLRSASICFPQQAGDFSPRPEKQQTNASRAQAGDLGEISRCE